jgi:hypothetical protein
MMAALFCAGMARAAHFHKLELAPQDTQHLECLLCIDANHLAAPPPLLKAPLFQVVWVSAHVSPVVSRFSQAAALSYDARGPPRP